MPEEAAVFLIDLGPLDVLLCAGDFYGAAAGSDVLEPGDAEAGAGPGAKGRRADGGRHAVVPLEPVLERLFSPGPPAEGVTATAFLMRRGNGDASAFIVNRNFEMTAVPLGEFRLLPAGLRRGGPGGSILALRFAADGRIQYLLDLRAMAEGGLEA